jgi:hypothetical protein
LTKHEVSQSGCASIFSYDLTDTNELENNNEASLMSGLKNPINQCILETSFIWFLQISKEWAKLYIDISCFMYLFKHIKIYFLQTEAEPAAETSCFVKNYTMDKVSKKKKTKTGSVCIS